MKREIRDEEVLNESEEFRDASDAIMLRQSAKSLYLPFFYFLFFQSARIEVYIRQQMRTPVRFIVKINSAAAAVRGRGF